MIIIFMGIESLKTGGAWKPRVVIWSEKQKFNDSGT